ncbi:MAG: c-type cytochrome biogenesis protein CcsB [bacterium]
MILLQISLLVYAAATVLYAIAVFWKSRFLALYSWWVLLAGGVLHLGFTVFRAVSAGRWPFLGAFESISFFVLLFVIIYLVVEKRLRTPSLGVLAAPMVFLFLFVAFFQSKQAAPLEPVLQSYWYPVHVSTLFFSYGLLALAFLGAWAYLLQEWLLKRKSSIGMLRYFPPLETLGDLCYRLVSLGFPLMTVGIVTGVVWAQSAWGVFWKWEPKLVFAMVTWLWYAVYLHLRYVGGWRGRRTNIILIIGFFILLFTFLAANYLPGEYHKFGMPGSG